MVERHHDTITSYERVFRVMSQNASSSMVVYAVEGFFLAKIPDVKENRGPQTPETPGKCRATKLDCHCSVCPRA